MKNSALNIITRAIINDGLVKGIYQGKPHKFNEGSTYMEIELYCVIDEKQLSEFRIKRKSYLETYAPVLYWTENKHINEMIVTVFVDGVHFSLHTITLDKLRITEKVKILYDPGKMIESLNVGDKDEPVESSDSFFDAFLLMFMLIGFKSIYSNQKFEMLRDKIDLRGSYELDGKTVSLLQTTRDALEQLSLEVASNNHFDELFFSDMASKMKAHSVENEELMLMNSLKDTQYIATDKCALTKEMFKYFGSKNQELREDLIVNTLKKWIAKDVYTKEELNKWLFLTMDAKHLFCNIGKMDDPSVITRSVSLSILHQLIHKHNATPFISDDDQTFVFNEIIRYIESETDYRGEVVGFGRAGCVQKVCAILKDWIKLKRLICHEKEMSLIYMSLQKFITNEGYVYVDGDEEIISDLIHDLMKSGYLSHGELMVLLEKLEEISRSTKSKRCVKNIRSFWKALYFRIITFVEDQEVTGKLKASIITTSN